MKTTQFLKAGLVAMTFALGAAMTVPAGAQDEEPAARDINDITCRDVIRMSGDDRDIAVAFLHGYILGDGDSTEFVVEELYLATDLFIEYCLDNTGAVAVDALRKHVE